MRIDIDKYKVNKAFIQKKYLEDINKPNRDMFISTMACSTGCPCIVVAYWVGEITGWPQEIIQTIKTLTIFYGYEEILNKPPGAPI